VQETRSRPPGSARRRRDTYAVRELREHRDYWYGSAAAGDQWPSLLGAESDIPVQVPVAQELATVRAIIDAA
jgi:hypothetical protein